MWKFKNPIKHAIPATRWPTAEEATRSLVYQPIKIGSIEANSRTWVPAMVPWRATDDGFVTKNNLDWYRRFAAGRPGVLVVEATGIREIPSGPLLRIGHDRFIPGLRELVDAVRDASGCETLLFIQCIDFLSIRRRPPRDKYFARFLAITDHHRDALVARTGEPMWRDASESAVRAALADLPDAALPSVLTMRELEDLDRG